MQQGIYKSEIFAACRVGIKQAPLGYCECVKGLEIKSKRTMCLSILHSGYIFFVCALDYTKCSCFLHLLQIKLLSS